MQKHDNKKLFMLKIENNVHTHIYIYTISIAIKCIIINDLYNNLKAEIKFRNYI